MENREEWRQVLRQHAARYPAMQPRDGVKLAYQSAFGGGHMVTDLAACTDWIEKEKQTAPAAAEPFEDIGGGYARLQLGCPAVKELPSWVVARVFAASAQPGMDPQALAGRLEVLRQETAAGTFGFSAQELEAFLREKLPVARRCTTAMCTGRLTPRRTAWWMPVTRPCGPCWRRWPGLWRPTAGLPLP